MKKFVNDPQQFVPGDAQGHRAGESGHAALRPRVQPDHAGRRAARRQGLDHPGLGLRPRARARDGGRPRHARRGLPGRRLRRAAVGLRLRDDQAAQQRQGRPAHHQQLHRRQDGLRHGPRARRGRRHQGRHGRRRRRRRGQGLDVHGRPPRRGRQLLRHQGARCRLGAGRRPATSLVALGERVNSVTRSMGMALTSCTPPAKGSPLFELGDDEIEMGVGIHGEPGRRREKLKSANEHHRRDARGGRHRPARTSRATRSR